MADYINTGAPPTLREIARQAGVSHTTVSLCLRNHPSIPEQTRNKIHQLADRLGYRSNLLVSALMSQVRMKHQRAVAEVVCFLTGGPTANEWKHHSANLGFYEGARNRGQQLGMRVEPFWLGPSGANAAETCRMLRARAIQGTLIAPFPIAKYSHPLDWSRMVCVALGYPFNNYPLHRATHNHFSGAYTAYMNLVRLGYTRIGLILENDENSRVNFSWLGGYLAAQQTVGRTSLNPLLTDGPSESWPIARWLKNNRPDAVIGFGPKQYLGFIHKGYSIPKDFAFAALDVQQARLSGVDAISGIDQNLHLIGATAIELLAGQLYHNELGLPAHPALSMIDGRWVDGLTTPKI